MCIRDSVTGGQDDGPVVLLRNGHGVAEGSGRCALVVLEVLVCKHGEDFEGGPGIVDDGADVHGPNLCWPGHAPGQRYVPSQRTSCGCTENPSLSRVCLLYTSDAADDLTRVD